MGLSFEKLRADSRNSQRVENERETSRMCSSKKSFGHSVPGRAIKTWHVTGRRPAQPRRLSVLRYNSFGASGSRMTKHRLLEEVRNSTLQISVQNVISNFLILILLFVSYSSISFNFYLFYFPGAPGKCTQSP